MNNIAWYGELANLVETGHGITFDLGGPRLELLTLSDEGAYCVMKGTLPAGVSIPLHSHGDAESFYILSGEAEVLAHTRSGLKWKTIRSGDFVHIPGGVKHAWRNLSANSAEMLCTTTPKLGRFLCEMSEFVGQAVRTASWKNFSAYPNRMDIGWATPEENAAVGISLQ